MKKHGVIFFLLMSCAHVVTCLGVAWQTWRGTRVIAIFDMRVIATVKHILILYILYIIKFFSLSTFDF